MSSVGKAYCVLVNVNMSGAAFFFFVLHVTVVSVFAIVPVFLFVFKTYLIDKVFANELEGFAQTLVYICSTHATCRPLQEGDQIQVLPSFVSM